MVFFKDLLEKEWFRLLGVGVICLVAGALLYPTKRIEEKMTQKHQEEISSLKEQHTKEVSSLTETLNKVTAESKSYKEESEKKYSMLKIENKDLKSKQKTSYYKLIKPDGTIEIKKFTESEVNESTKVVTSIQEEFKKKVESIETKWETIHKERIVNLQREFDSKESSYKKTIDELTKSKTTTINERTTTVDIGMMTNGDYFGHTTTTIRGPFIGSLHVDQKKEDLSKQQKAESVVGAGVGFSF